MLIFVHFNSKEFLPLQDAKKLKQKKRDKEKEELEKRRKEEERLNRLNKNKEITSHYAFNKPAIPPVS